MATHDDFLGVGEALEDKTDPFTSINTLHTTHWDLTPFSLSFPPSHFLVLSIYSHSLSSYKITLRL